MPWPRATSTRPSTTHSDCARTSDAMTGAGQGRVAALFLLPAMALMTGIFLVPLGGVAHQSVTNPAWTLEGYIQLTTSALFLRVLWTTFEISLSSSLATLILAYPIAYHLAKQPPRRRA